MRALLQFGPTITDPESWRFSEEQFATYASKSALDMFSGIRGHHRSCWRIEPLFAVRSRIYSRHVSDTLFNSRKLATMSCSLKRPGLEGLRERKKVRRSIGNLLWESPGNWSCGSTACLRSKFHQESLESERYWNHSLPVSALYQRCS